MTCKAWNVYYLAIYRNNFQTVGLQYKLHADKTFPVLFTSLSLTPKKENESKCIEEWKEGGRKERRDGERNEEREGGRGRGKEGGIDLSYT